MAERQGGERVPNQDAPPPNAEQSRTSWAEHRRAVRAANRARRAATLALIAQFRSDYECWYRAEGLSFGVVPVCTTEPAMSMTDEEIRDWACARIEDQIADLQELKRELVRAEIAELEQSLDDG